MIKVNQNNLNPQSQSLRDIHKIFFRIKNQKTYHENYRDIGAAINLLFYTLSSTIKNQINEEVIDNLIRDLKVNFKDRIKEDDLKNVFYE